MLIQQKINDKNLTAVKSVQYKKCKIIKEKFSNMDITNNKLAQTTVSFATEMISYNISHLNIKVSSWICGT